MSDHRFSRRSFFYGSLLAGRLGNANAADRVSGALITRQDYKDWLDVALSRLYPDAGKPTAISGYAGDVGVIPCYLHERTGQKKYLDLAMRIARAAIAKWTAGRGQSGRGYNFPDTYSRAYTYRYAVAKGDLTPAEIQTVKDILTDLSTKAFYEGGGMMNRILGLTLCLPPALGLVPDHPRKAELSQLLQLQVDELKATCEPLENSTNYDSITAYYFLAFIEENKLEQVFADPKMKIAFEKVLFNINPKGTIPWFGDYGGIERAAPGMIALMERAAAVYRDGRFKWAAHKLFKAEYAKLDPGSMKAYNGYELMGLAGAYYWADDRMAEVVPATLSALTYRTNGTLDKATFRAGWDEKDMFMMVDLINGYEHGDNDALAVISVSKDGVTYLHDSGGRNQSNHSAPLEAETTADFPLRDFSAKSGWQHAAFELDQNWSFGTIKGVSRYSDASRPGLLPASYGYDPNRQFAFAVLGYDAWRGSGKIYIDDIKLVDEKGKATVIESFADAPVGWQGTNFARVPGGKAGAHCGMAEFTSQQPAPYIGKVFNMPLDVHAGTYKRIEFWYRIEGASADFNTKYMMVTIGDRWMYPRNYQFFLNPIYPTIKKAFFDGRIGTYGDFAIDEIDVSGRSITREREILFARNKLAWVRDTFNLKNAGDYVCGPVWRVTDHSAVKDNAFDVKSEGAMLIYLVKRDGQVIATTSGIIDSERNTGAMRNRSVIYQQWKGQGPKANVTFDSILIPHLPGIDPGALADSIHVAYDRDGATLLQAGQDILLLNRSGKAVSTGGLKTDCQSLYLSISEGKCQAAVGTGGTTVQYNRQTIHHSAARQNIDYAPV